MLHNRTFQKMTVCEADKSATDMKRIFRIAGLAGAGFVINSIIRKVREYDFSQRVVLITGGSRGLGLVLAREFAKQGARLAICARDIGELERAKLDLECHGAEVITLRCDVTRRSEVEELVAQVQDYYGRIDVLVNNAGTIEVGPFEVMTIEDFENAMNTHFWAPLYTMLAVLPQMRSRREGRIINIASIGGKISVPHLLPYCASKHALVGLSEGLYAELRKDGVVVTTVCPGLMRTGSARNAEFKGKHRQEYALFSLSGALPITSMSAVRAARQIVAASKRGDAEVVLSLPAQIAAVIHRVFPDFVAHTLALVNGLLPDAGGIGKRKAKGKDSTSFFAPSKLTILNDLAAVRNNEFG
jgi:short-subunit dehydrogenase